jgi:hypothetical protein
MYYIEWDAWMKEMKKIKGHIRKENMCFWKSVFRRKTDDSSTDYRDDTFSNLNYVLVVTVKFYFMQGTLGRGLNFSLIAIHM